MWSSAIPSIQGKILQLNNFLTTTNDMCVKQQLWSLQIMYTLTDWSPRYWSDRIYGLQMSSQHNSINHKTSVYNHCQICLYKFTLSFFGTRLSYLSSISSWSGGFIHSGTWNKTAESFLDSENLLRSNCVLTAARLTSGRVIMWLNHWDIRGRCSLINTMSKFIDCWQNEAEEGNFKCKSKRIPCFT